MIACDGRCFAGTAMTRSGRREWSGGRFHQRSDAEDAEILTLNVRRAPVCSGAAIILVFAQGSRITLDSTSFVESSRAIHCANRFPVQPLATKGSSRRCRTGG